MKRVIIIISNNISHVYCDDLWNTVFNMHNNLKIKPDKLEIVTGYIGPRPFKELERLPFKSNVICGMYPKGMSKSKLDPFIKISKSHKKIQLNLTKKQIHSKIYVWLHHGKIIKALMGSANFSAEGLNTPGRETLAPVSKKLYKYILKYILSIKTVPPFINRNKNIINSIVAKPKKRGKNNIINGIINKNKIRLPLYSFSKKKNKKMVPKSSGLNWGLTNIKINRNGNKSHTSPEDQYIRIESGVFNSYQVVVPPYNRTFQNVEYKNGKSHKDKNSQPIDVDWDDGFPMMMSFEQEGYDKYKNMYPKALASFSNKIHNKKGLQFSARSILGEYIRNRIKNVIGKYPIRIKYSTLKKYGRDYITLTRRLDGSYHADFNPLTNFNPNKIIKYYNN